MTQRRTDVDLVRFLALVSMYVAHVAPIPGPAHVLELSEYLTMPLFALLVGVGAELGARNDNSARRRWWAVAVRAAVLVCLGFALERAGAQVVIVLVHLGILVVVGALLASMQTPAVAAAGVVAAVGGQLLLTHVSLAPLAGSRLATDAALFLWAGGPYRLLLMVLYTAIGIVLSRWWLRGGQGRPVLLPGAVGGGLLVLAAATLGAEQIGAIDLVPYSGTTQETLLDCLLAAGVLGIGLALARVLERARLGRVAASVAATAGAMTLTLYSLQIVWLAYDVRVRHPGQPDDTWTNLAVLVVGSVVFAGAWSAVVRAQPWRKGPVEGLVARAVRLMG